MYNVLIQNILKKNSDQEEGRERCDVGFGIAWPQGMGVVGGTNWEFMLAENWASGEGRLRLAVCDVKGPDDTDSDSDSDGPAQNSF